MDARTRRRPLVVVGAPTSAGSYAAGQESAPRVLREHGLLDRLRSEGREVSDAGDGPLQVWSPDPAHPFAQNFGAAADSIRAAADMSGVALDNGSNVLLLGGNCTVALGAMSALVRRDPDAALIYVDRHFDLNTPASTTDGALDWMGMAAALGLLEEPPEFGFPREPLLSRDQVNYVGITVDAATAWEWGKVEQLGLPWSSNEIVGAEPKRLIEAALDWADGRAFAIHLDLDVLDFIDLPLAENTDGRNSGPSLSAITTMLVTACAHPGFRVLSIGELNPTRAAGTPDAIPRFIEALGAALA